MSNAGAMKQLRGPKHENENWPVCDAGNVALKVQRAWMRASARGFGYLQSIGSWASWERELEVQRAWMRAPARMDMKFFF